MPPNMARNMKREIFQSIGILLFFAFFYGFQGLSNVYSQTATHDGIQPLIELHGRSLHDLIPSSGQPLVFAQEIEEFLERLEGAPPDWTQLGHSNMTEQSERLFQFNRQRDEARTARSSLINESIAFLWGGMLRQYLPEYQGFSLALGPELTNTSWGIIRFKPLDLPDYLVAIPSLSLREQLLARQKKGEQIEIMVVFIGTLISNESLIYAFSHESQEDGMILPVVLVQKILYILKEKSTLRSTFHMF